MARTPPCAPTISTSPPAATTSSRSSSNNAVAAPSSVPTADRSNARWAAGGRARRRTPCHEAKHCRKRSCPSKRSAARPSRRSTRSTRNPGSRGSVTPGEVSARSGIRSTDAAEEEASRGPSRTPSVTSVLLGAAAAALAWFRSDLLEDRARHATGGEESSPLLVHRAEQSLARRIDERDGFELDPDRLGVSHGRHARPASGELVHPGSGESALERDRRSAGACRDGDSQHRPFPDRKSTRLNSS